MKSNHLKAESKSWFRKFRRVMRFQLWRRVLHWTQFHQPMSTSKSKNISPVLAGRRGCRLCRCLTDFLYRDVNKNWSEKMSEKSVGILWKRDANSFLSAFAANIQQTIQHDSNHHSSSRSCYSTFILPRTTEMCRISVFTWGCSVAGVAVVAGLRKSSESVKHHFDFVSAENIKSQEEILWHGAKS